METNQEENVEITHIPLFEMLVKTTYLTQSTHPTDKNFSKHQYFGCGFMVKYKDRKFFVTADHNLHPEDYFNEDKVIKRSGIDYTISIFNNVQSEDQELSTIITPLSGFHYMEKIKLDKPKDLPELMDVCVSIMKPINLEYPFLTNEIDYFGMKVNGGEDKFCFIEEMLVNPTEDHQYFIFGKIKTKMKGIRLEREACLKPYLKYICKSGDYYLLETQEEVVYEKWAGLSGSPVLSQEGNCIGVLSSVLPGTKRICVLANDKMKMLLDLAIMEEQDYKK